MRKILCQNFKPFVRNGEKTRGLLFDSLFWGLFNTAFSFVLTCTSQEETNTAKTNKQTSSSKSTTKETHDTTSLLKESSRDGILYLRKQCVFHLSTLSKVIWQGYVTRRWAFSRIADPLSLKVNLGTTGLTNPVSNPVSKYAKFWTLKSTPNSTMKITTDLWVFAEDRKLCLC